MKTCLRFRQPGLWLFLIALFVTSCTVQTPLSRPVQNLHNGAQNVYPYYQVKAKSPKARRAAWLYPLVAGAVLGGLMYAQTTDPKTKAPYTDSQKLENGTQGLLYGGGIGLYFGGMTFLLNKRRVSERVVQPSQFNAWLSDYGRANNTTYSRLGQSTSPYLIVPQGNLNAYTRTEQELRERAERERREAEERAELSAYQNVLNGILDAHSTYVNRYPAGKYINEVRALQLECNAYYQAMRGSSKDVELFLNGWPNAQSAFRNAVTARKERLDREKQEAERQAELARNRAERRLRESKSWVQGDNICMETDGTSTSTNSLLFWSYTSEEKAHYTFRAFVEGYNEDHTRFKIRIADIFKNGKTEIGKFEFTGTTVWRTNDVVWIDPREWDFLRCP